MEIWHLSSLCRYTFIFNNVICSDFFMLLSVIVFPKYLIILGYISSLYRRLILCYTRKMYAVNGKQHIGTQSRSENDWPNMRVSAPQMKGPSQYLPFRFHFQFIGLGRVSSPSFLHLILRVSVFSRVVNSFNSKSVKETCKRYQIA